MARARQCLLLIFLLFQMAAFGASAPLEPNGAAGGGGTGGGAEEVKAEVEKAAKNGSELSSHDVSSSLIKPSESRTLPSGETLKTDQTEAKESKTSTESKNVQQSVSSSRIQDPDLSRQKESGIFLNNAKPPQADSNKLEPLSPAADRNQGHTSELDSAAKKLGLNEVKQEVDLPPEGLPNVSVPDSQKTDPNKGKETLDDVLTHVSVTNSPSKKADSKEGQETPKNLPPVPDSGSKKSDRKEGKETHKDVLPDVPVPNSPSKKTDSKEDKETNILPLSIENNKSAADVPKAPPLKEDQNEANQNGISTKNLKPPQPAETVPEFSSEKPVQNGKLPSTVENNLPGTSVSKDEDDDDDDDGLEEGEMVSDDKVGEEIARASQSEKEEAKSSPAGPAPKTGSENSHFFAYLVTTAIVVAALYIAYHNKRKIIAFALEGKKSKIIRRPKSSDYQRLDQKI